MLHTGICGDNEPEVLHVLHSLGIESSLGGALDHSSSFEQYIKSYSISRSAFCTSNIPEYIPLPKQSKGSGNILFHRSCDSSKPNSLARSWWVSHWKRLTDIKFGVRSEVDADTAACSFNTVEDKSATCENEEGA